MIIKALACVAGCAAAVWAAYEVNRQIEEINALVAIESICNYVNARNAERQEQMAQKHASTMKHGAVKGLQDTMKETRN